MIQPDHPTLFAFARTNDCHRLAVYANLSDSRIPLALDGEDADARPIFGNLPPAGSTWLAPWEARVHLTSEAAEPFQRRTP